jgi:hypothetical protein
MNKQYDTKKKQGGMVEQQEEHPLANFRLLYSTTYIRRSIYAVVLESMQLAHALLA